MAWSSIVRWAVVCYSWVCTQWRWVVAGVAVVAAFVMGLLIKGRREEAPPTIQDQLREVDDAANEAIAAAREDAAEKVQDIEERASGALAVQADTLRADTERAKDDTASTNRVLKEVSKEMKLP